MSKRKHEKKQLHEIVEDLVKRLDRAEKEIIRLKGVIQSKSRKVIHDWLNQSDQTPAATFDVWRKEIQPQTKDVQVMMNGSVSAGLIDGVISCMTSHVANTDGICPIRCFTQKPKTFYVYNEDSDGIARWKILRNENDVMTLMMDSVERKLRRKYRSGISRKTDQDGEDEDIDLDENQKIMDKINGSKLSVDKRLGIFKKLLYSKLEETLNIITETEYL